MQETNIHWSKFQIASKGRSTMSVRKAISGDLGELLELYRFLHPGDVPLPAPTVVEAIWADILADPRHFVFVDKEQGHLVSTCVLQVILNLTRGARPYGLIEN